VSDVDISRYDLTVDRHAVTHMSSDARNLMLIRIHASMPYEEASANLKAVIRQWLIDELATATKEPTGEWWATANGFWLERNQVGGLTLFMRPLGDQP
jgi:hypothetical protein